MNAAHLLLFDGQPLPDPRKPLPSLPPGVYDRTLPSNQVIPTSPVKRWPRANWFSVEVPGLPWIDGQSREHPEMLLSFMQHRYESAQQQKNLDAHAARKFSHFMTSWANARQDGLSLAQYVEVAKRVKGTMPFHHVMLAGKETDPRDAQWPELEPTIAPCLEALIRANAVDMVSLWETQLWQAPGAPLQTNLDGISAICKPNGVDQWFHNATEMTWWGTTNRADWWQQQIGVLTGILYQGNVAWDMPLRQAHIADSTNNRTAAPTFADGRHLFCAAEMDGMSIYDPFFSEELSDLRGNLHLCTAGLTPVSGYCSGGRF